MNTDQLPDHFIYTPPVIEFVTVAAETCLLLENARTYTQDDFITKSIELLSLLYFKTSILTIPERIFNHYTERFVTEADYDYVREQIQVLLGEKDSFLETFHPDMSLSDTPIASFISENLADVYQEIKDFAANYQLAEADIINDAYVTCIEAFGEHWGQKLLNALRALHYIKYSSSENEEDYSKDIQAHKSIDRNNFLDFLRDD